MTNSEYLLNEFLAQMEAEVEAEHQETVCDGANDVCWLAQILDVRHPEPVDDDISE